MVLKQLFRLVVVAVAVAGSSCASDPSGPDLGTTESDVVLPPPTNLVVTNVRSDRQDLSWDPSPGATRYVIMRGFSPGTETSYTTCCLTGPPFIANHLNANTQYCWQVKNVNNLNQVSGPSNEVCLTTPGTIGPPATVTATAISSTAINVSWTAVSGATKYYVNQSTSGGAFTRVGSVLSPTVTFTKTGLTASTSYCYTLQAEDAGGNVSAASSPPACATTFLLGLEGYWRMDDLSGATATDSSGFSRNATLASATFTNAQPKAPIDDNKSMLSVTSAAGSVASTASGIGAFRLTGAFTIASWVYVTAAGDFRIMGMHNAGSCGVGALGWELSQLSASGGLVFIGQTGAKPFGQSVPLNAWTHVAVTFAGGTGGQMVLYVNGAPVSTTTYNASNNLTGALAFGHVGGCAGGATILDEISVYSRQLSGAEVANIGTVPPAPTNLMITSTNSTVMNLGWTAPGSGADKWIIMRGTAPGNETPYTHAPNPPTTFNADHLMPSTQYSWQVKTVQHNLVSAPSNEVVGTTNAGPAAPTGVTATAISQTRINVSWNAVTNATKYYVYMATAVGGPYTVKGSVLAPTTTLQVAGLTANTTYFFEVQAEDAGLVRSPMSAPAMATTFP